MNHKDGGEEPVAAFLPHALHGYAFLADGECGALVGPRGDFVWMCAPRWDSDAVFSNLLGGPGTYAVSPEGRYVWGGYYEEKSLIWRSRWVTETGIVECREALAFPGGPDHVVVLRRIVAVDGDAHLQVRLDPRAGFGDHKLSDLHHGDNALTARTGPLHLRWTGARQAHYTSNEGLAFHLRLAAGERHDLVLELSEHGLPDTPVSASAAWETTERAWHADIPDLRQTIAPRDAQHAYAVLRGLTSSVGGMVASATTSLPERSETGRDYDYRYVWIRDQCLAGEAVAAAGPYPLLDDAVRFVSARLLEDGPQLMPAYTVLGRPVPSQRSLALPGYPGSRKTVAGNHVNTQFQLDAFGESLLLFAAAAHHDHLDHNGWQAAGIAANAIAARWHEADAGIWELDPQQWTESRLICVAGLRAISAARTSSPNAGRWRALAESILSDTNSRSMHATGRWQRAPNDPRLDAALLLPTIRGALAADDPRAVATLQAIREELAVDNYMYRFRQRPGPLGEEEGAFLLCGFLMSLAESQQGHEMAALRWFERNRAACGPPGLFAEEYDITQRQLRGNLPQAFVHALLLESSARLAHPWGSES